MRGVSHASQLSRSYRSSWPISASTARGWSKNDSHTVAFLAQALGRRGGSRPGGAQHAVFGLSQLRDLGISATAVQLRARNRTPPSHPPRRLLAGSPRASHAKGHWMAAVLACGSGAVLSHRNAAALHGLRDTAQRRIEVTVPRWSSRSAPGIHVHRVHHPRPPPTSPPSTTSRARAWPERSLTSPRSSPAGLWSAPLTSPRCSRCSISARWTIRSRATPPAPRRASSGASWMSTTSEARSRRASSRRRFMALYGATAYRYPRSTHGSTSRTANR